MGDNSAIEWTDASWNPVTGCTKVSPGCAHCYAETVAGRFWPQQYVHTIERGFISAKDYNGERMDGKVRQFTDVMCHEDRLYQPLHWRKPRRVFVNSMSDLFHEDVPDVFIDHVFAVMALAPRHTFQVLTKRAERMRAYMSAHDIGLRWLVRLNVGGELHQDKWAYQEADALRWTREGLPNVWLGVSVENQHFADARIPLLLQTPAAVRFISAEPLLGPVDLEQIENPGHIAEGQRYIHALKGYAWEVHGTDYYDVCSIGAYLDWVIVGGESGTGARPFDLAWGRSIVSQCQAAGVPVFVKQLGANVVGDCEPRGRCSRGCHCLHSGERKLRSRKGGDPAEWSTDLRVRQFPNAPLP